MIIDEQTRPRTLLRKMCRLDPLLRWIRQLIPGPPYFIAQVYQKPGMEKCETMPDNRPGMMVLNDHMPLCRTASGIYDKLFDWKNWTARSALALV